MEDVRDFGVTVEQLGQATVARVTGDLDLATSPELETAVAGLPSNGRLVIDLTGCTFLDSTGLRAIVLAGRAREEAGGSAVIVAGQPGILRVLEIAAVDKALPIRATVEEAL